MMGMEGFRFRETQMKTCFKCRKPKQLDLFYRHPQMADGHLNKCITCAKKDAVNRYYNPKFIPRIRTYEKSRNKTAGRKLAKVRYQRASRAKNPKKHKCRNWIHNAIRDGKLTRMPCCICGDPKSEAHHVDYRKKECVVWFCFKHHRELAHKQLVFQL